MIEPNIEQRQAMAQGQPVLFIDPFTQDAYVVLAAEEYERLTRGSERARGQPHPEIALLMLGS